MSTETAQPTTPVEEMDMGALLDLEDAREGSLRRGEIVEGMVMGASPDGLIVDVGTKTEAIIPASEMRSLGADGPARLKAGDTVRVMVLQPASGEGHAVVSLDRARGEEGWDVLQERFNSGEIFEAQVADHNRGGILVNVEGVNAFIPLSQVDSVRRDDPDAVTQLSNLVGKSIMLKVIELNRKRNRVILSERAAMAEHRKEQKDKILDELNEGDIREGTISSITDFGVFVDLGGADGLAHMTELTWERGKKAKDIYNVGDPVKAYILKVDRETKKISLSLKRAQPEKWDGTVGRFVIGQILIGRVTKLMAFGAFVRLDGPVEGLIHISELSSRRIQHPKEVVKEGDVVPVKLVRIERDRHRLGLSLRQARSDAEAMGFVFDHLGMVIDYPDDVREQFQLPPRDKSLKARTEPRTAQEAVANAVARDPEPVSAFAHAFQQALENAEASNTLATAEPEDVTPVAEAAVGEAVTVADVAIDETPVAEVMTGEAAPVAEAMADEAAPVAEATTDEAAPVAEVMTDAETVPAAEIMTDEAAPVAEVITEEAPVPEAVVEEAPVAEAAVEEVSAAEETTSIAEARAEVVDQPEVAVEAVAEPVATTEDTPPASAEAPDAPGDTEPEAAVAEAGDASDAQEGDAPRES